jgi:hypothetical protein
MIDGEFGSLIYMVDESQQLGTERKEQIRLAKD